MLTAVRKRLTWANIAMTLALVFAMSGGAYAAGKYLITSTKQISPKVLKSLVGKAGKTGANGAPGAAGPAGPTGPPGPQGPAGAKGETGAQGVPGPEGKEGKEGPEGKEGAEGTFGGQKLPSGKTLKGQWAASGYGEGGLTEGDPGFALTAVTYSLPVELASEIGEEVAHYIPINGNTPSGCIGNVNEPGADPGNLCVFANAEANVESARLPLQGEPTHNALIQTGFQIISFTAAKGSIFLDGSWAVTAK